MWCPSQRLEQLRLTPDECENFTVWLDHFKRTELVVPRVLFESLPRLRRGSLALALELLVSCFQWEGDKSEMVSREPLPLNMHYTARRFGLSHRQIQNIMQRGLGAHISIRRVNETKTYYNRSGRPYEVGQFTVTIWSRTAVEPGEHIPPTPSPSATPIRTPQRVTPRESDEGSAADGPNEISSPQNPNEISPPQNPNEISPPFDFNALSSKKERALTQRVLIPAAEGPPPDPETHRQKTGDFQSRGEGGEDKEVTTEGHDLTRLAQDIPPELESQPHPEALPAEPAPLPNPAPQPDLLPASFDSLIPAVPQTPPLAAPVEPRPLSPDARLVAGVIKLLRDEGFRGNFFHEFKKIPEGRHWDRARWNAANADLRDPEASPARSSRSLADRTATVGRSDGARPIPSNRASVEVMPDVTPDVPAATEPALSDPVEVAPSEMRRMSPDGRLMSAVEAELRKEIEGHNCERDGWLKGGRCLACEVTFPAMLRRFEHKRE